MVKSLLVAAAFAASAGAFAPARQSRATTSLNEFANGYVGSESVEPMLFGLKSEKFDPLGFSERAPDWLPWFREAELKHGRAAMLATVGMIVPEFVRIPGEQFSKANIPMVLEAHDKLPESMIQIFGWISFLEACSFPALANMNEFDRTPGNFEFDPLGFYPDDPSKQKEMQLKELKNGRLAMVAIGGMVAGSSVTGHGFPYLP